MTPHQIYYQKHKARRVQQSRAYRKRLMLERPKVYAEFKMRRNARRAEKLNADGCHAIRLAEKAAANADRLRKLNEPRKMPQATHAKMMEMLRGGRSTNSTAKELGLSQRTVWKWAKRASEIHHKQHNTTYEIDDRAFSKITEQVAYWAGFLMTDGCVCNGAVVLRLHEKDAAHIEKFRSFLSSSHPITFHPARFICSHGKTINSGPQVRIYCRSKRLTKSLARFGIVERKTHVAKVLKLEMNRHFWRGCIDGDGSLGISGRGGQPVLSFVGSTTSSLGGQFVYFIRSICPSWRGNIGPGHGGWQVRASCRPAIEIMRVLYDGAHVSLDRKQALADYCIKNWSPRNARGRLLKSLVEPTP